MNFDYTNEPVEKHSLYNWIRELRRDFHRHPETAFEEKRTTQKIKDTLSGLGVELIETNGMETGAVAVLRGGRPGKSIALRTDIDALPITEKVDLPYRSVYPGRMHACGHDAHMAIMLGTAKNLVSSIKPDQLCGQIYFIFQPAEEVLSGAKQMISKGIFKHLSIDCILACHVILSLDIGQVAIQPGPVYAAADWFSMNIQGKGAHAGYPHLSIDPISAGADFVNSLPAIIKSNVKPSDTCVITTAAFNAGQAANVIPDEAVLKGTIRTYKKDVRERIIEKFKALIHSVEINHGVNIELDLNRAVPALINDTAVSGLIRQAAVGVVGDEFVTGIDPKTGSEDFACYLDHIKGAMCFLGCRDLQAPKDVSAHSPEFQIDERVLPIGVEVFTRACLLYLDDNQDRDALKV